jgi:uncharacterized protein (TIGR02996 family)
MTTMTDDQVLLRAIIEAPQDDAPRLVYADWLEERGAPGDAERAEFIRLQLAMAALQRGEPKWMGLRRREYALWLAHRDAWVSHLPKLARWECRPEFERGFVEMLSCTVSQFLKVAAGTVRATPLRRLRLTCMAREQAARLADLVRCPHLARITDLELSHLRISDRGARELASCPYLGKVTRLRVWANHHLGEDGRQALRERFGERLELR